MTSYLCNKDEQITPSYLLSVNYYNGRILVQTIPKKNDQIHRIWPLEYFLRQIRISMEKTNTSGKSFAKIYSRGNYDCSLEKSLVDISVMGYHQLVNNYFPSLFPHLYPVATFDLGNEETVSLDTSSN